MDSNMSEFEKEFSQFAEPVPKSASPNESDFEKLSFNLDSGEQIAFSHSPVSSKTPEPDLGLGGAHYSTDRPLGLAEPLQPQLMDEDPSPILMIPDSSAPAPKTDDNDYEDLLAFSSGASDSKYGVTQSQDTEKYSQGAFDKFSQDLQTSSMTDSSYADLDPLSDFKPEPPTATTFDDHDFLEDIKPRPVTPPQPIKQPVYADKSPVKDFSPERKKSPLPEKVVAPPSPIPTPTPAPITKPASPAKVASLPKGKGMSKSVLDLIYWRDVKQSGIVFGTSMLVLLSLSYCSLISVVAYLSLALLIVTLTFRIYKNVLQAVQKSGEGHPFKDYLDMDVSLPQDKVQQVTDILVKRLNVIIGELRRLFLIEDLVDSLKFGLLLWCFTYIGAWFNGMTLLILAFVGAFSIPKIYETYQVQIDRYLGIANTQIQDILEKVKAKIPILNKPKTQ